MIENRPFLNFLTHLILIVGVVTVVFPVYLAFIAATHGPTDFMSGLMPLLPGDQLITNFDQLLSAGNSVAGAPPFALMLANSLLMAVMIAVGKIAISIISAFAIVYFRFPLRMVAFWIIFLTLMLPVEVRILPTYEAVANVALPLQWLADVAGIEVTLDWNMMNSYGGLILPLIASATATFLFRQFFLTVPEELCEAARIDGCSPLRFFRSILLPLSVPNMVALAIILFLYGWNQYLWPLLFTTDKDMATAVIGLKSLIPQSDSEPAWNIAMNAALLVMLPPVVVVMLLQRWLVKGLVDAGK